MKKIILLVVISLLYMCTVNAYTSGELTNVTNITECYGNVTVKVEPKHNADKDYEIPGCIRLEEEGRLWKCECLNPTKIVFRNNENQSNEFDFVVEYYIKPNITNQTNSTLPTQQEIYNDANKRSKEINNLVFENPEKPLPGKQKMPKFENVGIVFLIVGVVILIIILIIILVIKLLSNSDDYMSDKKQEGNENIVFGTDVSDDDIGDMIRKL